MPRESTMDDATASVPDSLAWIWIVLIDSAKVSAIAEIDRYCSTFVIFGLKIIGIPPFVNALLNFETKIYNKKLNINLFRKRQEKKTYT